MDPKPEEVELFWIRWYDAVRIYPFRTILLVLLVAFLIVAGAFLATLGARLASVEQKVGKTETQITVITNQVNVITKVEKEIANIKEMIEQLYDRVETDLFRPSDIEMRCAFTKPDGGQIVALRLSSRPVQRSVQGIWANQVLYPGSMRFADNVLITVFTADTPPTNETFSITYVRDIEKGHLFQKMEVKDNALYLDGRRFDHASLP